MAANAPVSANGKANPSCQPPRWPLFALLWRVLILGPVAGTIGIFAFALATLSLLGPPNGAALLALDGQYGWSAALAVAWSAWLPWGWRLCNWMLQGLEHPNF